MAVSRDDFQALIEIKMLTRTENRAEAVEAEAAPAALCLPDCHSRGSTSEVNGATHDSGAIMDSTRGETLTSYWELPSYWE